MERTDSGNAVTAGDDDPAAQRRPDGGPSPKRPPKATDNVLVRPSQPVWEQVARRTAHWAIATVGRPAYRARMLPGFVIVGAERAGTTSLWDALIEHPAIFGGVLPRKELHYFDYQYDRGLAWYQCHFPFRAVARLSARRSGVAPVAFEASPYYMFHPLAPERISRDLPGVKIVVMLRDPVARAYSAHVMRVTRGLETESFERALELEDSRLAGETERLEADPGYISYNHRHFAYRARGQYIDQLERLEQAFGRDRIHIMDSSEFFKTPEPVYDNLLEFLGLPNRGYPDFDRPSTSRPRAQMPESVRTALEDHFRPYDERLAAWLGYEPSWRR